MVPMPAVIVLIVCKTAIAGPPDQNSQFTKSQNREWAYENSMMVCRRQEVQMVDMDEGKPGADPQPFNEMSCQRAAMTLIAGWDTAHPNSNYRAWRVACPVKVVDPAKATKEDPEGIVAWKLPDCGHQDTVVCEVDTAI